MSAGTLVKQTKPLTPVITDTILGGIHSAGKCRLGVVWSVGYESIVIVGELAPPPAA